MYCKIPCKKYLTFLVKENFQSLEDKQLQKFKKSIRSTLFVQKYECNVHAVQYRTYDPALGLKISPPSINRFIKAI